MFKISSVLIGLGILLFIVYTVFFADPASESQNEYRLVSKAAESNREFDVVFLHGLGGSTIDTWRTNEDTKSFPDLLAEDFPNADVWAVGYDASPSEWTGATMNLSDRAKNVLTGMEARNIGTGRPVYLICHSLGGLVAKNMFQQGLELNDLELQAISSNIDGFVFFGTPHRGSVGADYLAAIDRILKVTQLSASIDDLKVNSTKLLDLNEYFVREATLRNLDSRCLSFYETIKTRGVTVVDRFSADPGFSRGSIARSAGADHLSICKPKSRDNTEYLLVSKKLKAWTKSVGVYSTESFLRELDQFRDQESGEAVDKYLGSKIVLKSEVAKVKVDERGPYFQLVKSEQAAVDAYRDKDAKGQGRSRDDLRAIELAIEKYRATPETPLRWTSIVLRPETGADQTKWLEGTHRFSGRVTDIQLETQKLPKEYE